MRLSRRNHDNLLAWALMPRVSVILCGYNQGRFLKHAIDSVLGQSYQDLELLVIDNGSTDHSSEILEAYRTHPKVSLSIHPSNQHVTRCLNLALQKASGEFISILYADDFYLPEKIEKQVRLFESLPNDFGVVYSPGFRLNIITGHQYRDNSLSASGFILNDMFERTHKEGFINPISPLIRRECYEKFPYHEDVFTEGENIFFRFACSYKFSFLDEPLVVMREHEENAGKAVKRNIALIDTLLTRLNSEDYFPQAYDPLLKLYLARTYRNCGWMGIRLYEDPQWARDCFRRARHFQSRQAIHPRIMAGWCLSWLPKKALHTLNRLGFALSRNQSVIGYKDDYV